MGVIKVESFDVDVSAATGQTHTLSNDVGSLNSAFVRRTTSIDKQSGPTGSTANTNPNNACSAAFLSATNQISFRQNNATTQKLIGEVWRYTGAASGPDEFIVRGRYEITVTGNTASQAVTGIVNRDRCIPFFTGASSTATSVNDFDSSTVSVYIDGSDTIQLERGATTGTLVVYVTVVEFTGSNWSVGHGRSANHDAATETVTLNTASDGTSGSAFSVGDWENAMIVEASLEGDTAETGLSDNLGVWSPLTATQANFILQQDGAARNDGVSYCHVLAHPSLVVHRETNLNISEGNGSYGTLSFPVASSLVESLDELSLEWFADTTGVGTAHARGRVSARVTSAAGGTIQHWVHRSGNNVRADWGVAQLGGITGVVKVVLDDVDTDNVIGNTQQNVIITASGGGLSAVQGTGKVELVQNSDYSGTIVSQTIESWSDTSIQIDVSAGALADTNCFLYVTTDTDEVGSLAVQVGLPPETYKEAILAMLDGPDHYWTFQDTYVDEIGGATANAAGTGGTPTFDAATHLVKGDTHSLLLNSASDSIRPDNQTTMNDAALSRRYVGGWIMFDRISQTLAVVWEEGGAVNNMALLNGFGNNMMFQIADAAEDYVQLYMDVPLAPNRPYHFLAKFHGSGFDGGQCAVYLDGVKQSRTDGNPWEQPELDSHTGSITWGQVGGESLKVGDDRGVDATTISFPSPVACNYAHWYSWSDSTLNEASDIRVTLFEKGAPAAVTISTDTQANMQTALDAYADTVRPDWPCCIEVANCLDGDFDLTLDNITFDPLASIQIRYVGASTLTLTTANGSSLDPTKLATPYGGTIIVNNPALLTLTGLQNPTEVRVYVAGTTNEIGGQESVTSGTFSTSVEVASVDISILALGYQNLRLKSVTISGNLTLPIQQVTDRQYSND